MEPVKEKNINFDSFDKFVGLILDLFSVCALVMLEKPSPLRFILWRIKVFPKVFLSMLKLSDNIIRFHRRVSWGLDRLLAVLLFLVVSCSRYTRCGI